MTLDEMTKEERSLLLYFESRAVDHGGLVVVTPLMNNDDLKIAEQWNETGPIHFGRLAYKSIKPRGATHWCKLSEEAWTLAHAERRARYNRLNKQRTWITTEEKREGPEHHGNQS